MDSPTDTSPAPAQSNPGPTVVNLDSANVKTPGSGASPRGSLPLLIIGAVVLLLVASGAAAYLYVLPKMSSKAPVSPVPTKVVQAPSSTTPATLDLAVSAPADNLLVTSKTLTVSGKTEPNVIVTVYTDSDESTIQSDDKGTFVTTVSLDRGINTVTVGAFSDTAQNSKNINVVYDDGSS